jgi:hypothetical protein
MIAPAKKTYEAPLLVDAETAARMLGNLSTRTLARLTVPHGPIRCLRIGTGKRPIVRYKIADLEKFIDEQAASVAEA